MKEDSLHPWTGAPTSPFERGPSFAAKARLSKDWDEQNGLIDSLSRVVGVLFDAVSGVGVGSPEGVGAATGDSSSQFLTARQASNNTLVNLIIVKSSCQHGSSMVDKFNSTEEMAIRR